MTKCDKTIKTSFSRIFSFFEKCHISKYYQQYRLKVLSFLSTLIISKYKPLINHFLIKLIKLIN